MRKILTFFMTAVIALGLFTFALAETNVSTDKTDSISIIQTESPQAQPTISDFAVDFAEAKAVYPNKNSAAVSTILETPGKVQLNNVKARLNNQEGTTNYSPPDSSCERIEPTTIDYPDKNLKPNFEPVKSRRLVQRE